MRKPKLREAVTSQRHTVQGRTTLSPLRTGSIRENTNASCYACWGLALEEGLRGTSQTWVGHRGVLCSWVAENKGRGAILGRYLASVSFEKNWLERKTSTTVNKMVKPDWQGGKSPCRVWEVMLRDSWARETTPMAWDAGVESRPGPWPDVTTKESLSALQGFAWSTKGSGWVVCCGLPETLWGQTQYLVGWSCAYSGWGLRKGLSLPSSAVSDNCRFEGCQQCLSTEEHFGPLRKVAMSGDIFSYHNWEGARQDRQNTHWMSGGQSSMQCTG